MSNTTVKTQPQLTMDWSTILIHSAYLDLFVNMILEE